MTGIRSRARATQLALPTADLSALRRRVGTLAEDRPGVYRMLDPLGRAIYVGKARRLRRRLLSYFRAPYPDDKAARILYAAASIEWDYAPSEFAASLLELRLIQRHRPPFNRQLNRVRRTVLITVSDGPAPRIARGVRAASVDGGVFGPFSSAERTDEAVKTLNDLLGLRDCATRMPMVFAGQGDLFSAPSRAACPRHDFGFCSGPCAGYVTEREYRQKVAAAIAFLRGLTIQPIDRVVSEMERASAAGEFERATKWRERFEHLEWLLAATTRARAAVELLTFVYRDPGEFGDDRAYLIRAGTVRASYPFPQTPIERVAFSGVVQAELGRPDSDRGALSSQQLDEVLLMMAWFRRHPEALRRTTRLEEWLAA